MYAVEHYVLLIVYRQFSRNACFAYFEV